MKQISCLSQPCLCEIEPHIGVFTLFCNRSFILICGDYEYFISENFCSNVFIFPGDLLSASRSLNILVSTFLSTYNTEPTLPTFGLFHLQVMAHYKTSAGQVSISDRHSTSQQSGGATRSAALVFDSTNEAKQPLWRQMVGHNSAFTLFRQGLHNGDNEPFGINTLFKNAQEGPA